MDFDSPGMIVPWQQQGMGDSLRSHQSGILACAVNVSQFYIINEAGPVSSTVVGHFKTCIIVALGWVTSGRSIRDGTVVGIIAALGGIIS